MRSIGKRILYKMNTSQPEDISKPFTSKNWSAFTKKMYSRVLGIAVVASLYVLVVKCEDDKKICPFLAACIKETDGKVKVEDVKVLMTAKEEDLDNISEDVLCVSKCALEKRQVVVNEKIDMEKLSTEKMLTHNIEDKDGFMDCMKKIESIKECGDVKEFMRCKLKFTKA